MTIKPAPRDLERTKADILDVATQHFTRNGFYGARVDEIAEETSTTKRMIYYCFGSKDGLFSACLHAAYAGIREHERGLHLEDMPPAAAIDAYVRGTIRYHEAHPELALLVRSENTLGAVHLVDGEASANRSIVDALDAVVARGRDSGEFRPDATGIDVHVAVTALANFRITNQATIAALFGFATRDPDRLDHDLDQYADMVLGWLSSPRRSERAAEVEQPGQPAPATPPAGNH